MIDFLKKVFTNKDIWFGIGMIVVAMLLYNNAKAKESWLSIDVICDDDFDEMVRFYRQEELSPMMAGGGNDLNRSGGQTPVVNFIMQEPDGDFAVIRYYKDKACLLAVGGKTIYDAEILENYLGLNK